MKPLLFSAPMVRALLAGTKSQTRRLITPGNSTVLGYNVNSSSVLWTSLDFRVATPRNVSIWGPGDPHLSVQAGLAEEECFYRVRPRLEVGDRLWVKETWKTLAINNACKPTQLYDCPIAYAAGGPIRIRCSEGGPDRPATDWQIDNLATKWRSPLFMLQWMSRIHLEVIALRAERLQSISETDAEAEGITRIPGLNQWNVDLPPGVDQSPYASPVLAYRDLWQHLHGPDSWTANPWVWVTTVRRVQS